MHTRNRVDDRAQAIFEYLKRHLGDGYTLSDLCAAVGIRPGATTTHAIRRARDLATEAGLHFPPAVPRTDFLYRITDYPGHAIDPTLHMSRIASGAQQRATIGVDFMRGRLKEVDPADRPAAAVLVRLHVERRKAHALLDRAADDALAQLIELRRSS